MEKQNPPGIVTQQPVAHDKVKFAQQMRQDMPQCEAILWDRLRKNALGVKFRRQQIAAGYIADFYCHSASLVIEVDGPTHDPEYDKQRDEVLTRKGLRVLRFTNDQVRTRIGYVLSEIKNAIADSGLGCVQAHPSRRLDGD